MSNDQNISVEILDTLSLGTFQGVEIGYIVVFIALLSAGILGGVYRTLNNRNCKQDNKANQENNSECNSVHFSENILLALMASFLSPLFLYIVDNSIVNKMKSIAFLSGEFYYIFGFGLLTAIYAERFIDGLARRVQNNEAQIKLVEEKHKETEKEHIATKEQLIAKSDLLEQENIILEQKVNRSEALSLLGMIEAYLNSGLKDHIDKAYEYIIKLENVFLDFLSDSQRCHVYVNKAFAVKRMKNSTVEAYEEALSILEKAEDECSNNKSLYYNKACYCAHLSEIDKAVDSAKKLYTLDEQLFKDLEKDPEFKGFIVNERYKNMKKGLSKA